MTSDYKDFRKQVGACTDAATRAKHVHTLLATLVVAHRTRVITVAAACRLLRLQMYLGRLTKDELDSMCKRIARATNWGWEMLMPYGARHTTVARDSVESQDMRRAINKALEELKELKNETV